MGLAMSGTGLQEPWSRTTQTWSPGAGVQPLAVTRASKVAVLAVGMRVFLAGAVMPRTGGLPVGFVGSTMRRVGVGRGGVAAAEEAEELDEPVGAVAAEVAPGAAEAELAAVEAGVPEASGAAVVPGEAVSAGSGVCAVGDAGLQAAKARAAPRRANEAVWVLGVSG